MRLAQTIETMHESMDMLFVANIQSTIAYLIEVPAYLLLLQCAQMAL